jgi:hypothetical protein
VDRGDVTPEQFQRLLADNKACQDGIGAINSRVLSLEVRINELSHDASELKRDLEGRMGDPDHPGIRARVRKIEERLVQIHETQAEHGRTLKTLDAFVSRGETFFEEWNNIKQQGIGGRKTLYVIGGLLIAGQGLTLGALFQLFGVR